jgi:SPP1 family phage portal protein
MAYNEILKDLIETDINSLQTIRAKAGIRYYDEKHDILKRDFREYFVKGIRKTDYMKSNEKMVNPFHTILVEQKQSYITGKPVTISSEDAQLEEKVNELLGKPFQREMAELVTDTANQGYCGLMAYIDEDGEFAYTRIDGTELIFVKDQQEKMTVQAIRYYPVVVVEGGKEKHRYRVEVIDDEKTTYYMETDKGYEWVIPGSIEDVPLNPRYHWYEYDTRKDIGELEETGLEPHSWGKVPVIQVKNNAKMKTDLQPIKNYIDALDLVTSGFINDLKDVQLAIWVLKGYDGESLQEFMTNLMQFKAIKLDEDGAAEPKTMDIPKEARSALMEYCVKQIYSIGQGVNVSELAGGSLTNVAIKAHYAGLDLKARRTVTYLDAAIEEFLWFVVEFINGRDNTTYNHKDLKITFDFSMLFNETEIIENLLKSQGTLSQETLLAKHPYVSDVQLEIKKLEEERPIQIVGDSDDDSE